MSTKNTKQLLIRMNDFEDGLINDLIKLGWSKSTIIRMAIRSFHEQEFGKAIKKKAKMFGVNGIDERKRIPKTKLRSNDDLTDVEYCEKILNGSVTEINGIKCCEFTNGTATFIKPLTKIKKVKID